MREIIDGRRAASPDITNATLRRDLVAIGSVIDFAIGEEDLAADHNAATAALERISERRDPIVLPEPAHIARVIAEASPNLAPIIAAALKTGCRKTELVTAQRPRLDHERRQLTIIGKRNKLRVIDLVTPAGDAYQALRAAPARLGCKWLFWHHDGQPFRSVSERFHELVEAVHGARSRRRRSAPRPRARIRASRTSGPSRSTTCATASRSTISRPAARSTTCSSTSAIRASRRPRSISPS
jgi:integrase